MSASRNAIAFIIAACLAAGYAVGAEAPSTPTPPAALASALDTAQLQRMESAARAWLDFLVRAQRHGALPETVPYDPHPPSDEAFSMLNSDYASGIIHPLLWGYRIWGDERYLRAACALARLYERAQFPEGGWSQNLRVGPGAEASSQGDHANLEEWTQSNGIRALAACYYLTGRESYKRAVMKAGELILRAQDPVGWWPWGVPVSPQGRLADYLRGPTLNDWNLNACMGDCLLLYHMTGDERYLRAIFAAGEWIISAQIESPTPGWAAQYDLHGKPSWARFMEPPAADTVFGTHGAGDALLMLYDISADDRYLVPLRKHLAWLQSIPQEQRGWIWYAHQDWSADQNTARPSDYTRGLAERYDASLPSEEAQAGIAIRAGEAIIAYHYQMVPVNHPEVECYLKPLNGHYGSRSEGVAEWLAGQLEARADGPIVPAWTGPIPAAEREAARPAAGECAAQYAPGSVSGSLEQLESWQRGEPVRGLLEVTDEGKDVRLARGCSHASALLRQIALAYAALGKIGPDIIPMYGGMGHAGDVPLVDPSRDWYAVPIPRAR